jgi:septal ring factor EnvC (AmiA/AmiB activator)
MATKHSPQYYSNTIKKLDTEFTINLKEMSSTFPYAKTYPDISTYTKKLSEEQGATDKTRSSIFLLRDNIEQDIHTVDASISNIITQIEKLDKDNNELSQHVDNLNDRKEGADGMFQDSRELYNFTLLQNWIMFFSICGLGVGLYKFKTTM